MAQTPLLPLLRRLIERDPADAARQLQSLDEAAVAGVLQAMPPTVTADLIARLPGPQAAAALQKLGPETVGAVMTRIGSEQAVSILMSAGPELRKSLLEALPESAKKDVQELLQFPENSAGRILTTRFIAFESKITVKDAIARIRTLAGKYGASTYTYVVDGENHLLGVLNMRDLMLAQSGDLIETVMQKDVFTVDGFMDREDVAYLLRARKYLAAPVIDTERRLLGVVKLDQLMGDIEEEGTEDILKMVGAGSDERINTPVLQAYRKRMGWLTFNLATAFLAASVVGLFQDIIARITVLAVFLPVVAGQGGNAGAQSLAVVMRGLVMREIQSPWKLVAKEFWVGALNGMSIGIITAAVAWAWHGNPWLGLVIGLAMIVNLCAAGLSGAAIPLAMKACGFDPAQSSSIILTTVTDVVGFFAFLGFAVVFQHHLV